MNVLQIKATRKVGPGDRNEPQLCFHNYFHFYFVVELLCIQKGWNIAEGTCKSIFRGYAFQLILKFNPQSLIAMQM